MGLYFAFGLSSLVFQVFMLTHLHLKSMSVYYEDIHYVDSTLGHRASLSLTPMTPCRTQLAKAVLLVLGSVAAARRLHANLLACVVRLPMSFFDSQPSGRLLYRFTKDTGVEYAHIVCIYALKFSTDCI